MIPTALLTLGLLDSFFPSSVVNLPQSGQKVSLFGSGPPVMFSSGLFGLMPRRLYTNMFTELMGEATIVVLNDIRPVTRQTFEETADTLGVDKMGFFSHSAIDGSILDSDRIESAVLCDPVTIPQLLPTFPLGMPEKPRSDVSTLVIRAGQAYNPDVSTPIPDFQIGRAHV